MNWFSESNSCQLKKMERKTTETREKKKRPTLIFSNALTRPKKKKYKESVLFLVVMNLSRYDKLKSQ